MKAKYTCMIGGDIMNFKLITQYNKKYYRPGLTKCRAKISLLQFFFNATDHFLLFYLAPWADILCERLKERKRDHFLSKVFG